MSITGEKRSLDRDYTEEVTTVKYASTSPDYWRPRYIFYFRYLNLFCYGYVESTAIQYFP